MLCLFQASLIRKPARDNTDRYTMFKMENFAVSELLSVLDDVIASGRMRRPWASRGSAGTLSQVKRISARKTFFPTLETWLVAFVGDVAIHDDIRAG